MGFLKYAPANITDISKKPFIIIPSIIVCATVDTSLRRHVTRRRSTLGQWPSPIQAMRMEIQHWPATWSKSELQLLIEFLANGNHEGLSKFLEPQTNSAETLRPVLYKNVTAFQA
jgi:hypothetical protein